MQLLELLSLLNGEVIWGLDRIGEFQVEGCFAADLMSDVLAFCRPGALLITGLTSIQATHTADVADLAAILFVGNKRPAKPVLDLARERRIPLLTTPLSMFDACGILHRAGLKAAVRA